MTASLAPARLCRNCFDRDEPAGQDGCRLSVALRQGFSPRGDRTAWHPASARP
ncbi:hypothetical protein PJI17_29570 [Mycobacterium kansasii]